MIKVTIEQTVEESYEVTESVVTKETPTGIVEEFDRGYGSGTNKKVQFEREYAPTVVRKTRERKITLLEQEIEDDAAFDFRAVVATINGIRIATDDAPNTSASAPCTD